MRRFTSYCDVEKCVFLFVGFISNKALKKSQEIHHTLTPSPVEIVKESFLSTVKAYEFTSQSEFFCRLWKVWF